MARTDAASGRRSRIGLRVGIGVVGVFLIAILALHLYLTPERLRRLIEPQLESALNREVRLERVGLSLWRGIAASVEGLEVSDRPGFGDDPFVKADRAAISLDLWTLLKGEAKLGEITIENPRVSVVVNEQGEANYEDLAEPDEEAPAEGGPPPLPVDRLVLTGGVLRHEDRKTGSTTVIDGIDYRIGLDLGVGSVKSLGHLSIGTIESRTREGEVFSFGMAKLSHRLTVDARGDRLLVESLQVVLGPVGLEATGEVQYALEALEISLTVADQVIDMAQVEAYLRETGLAEEGFSLAGEVRVSLRIRGPWNPEATPPAYPDVSGEVVLTGAFLEDLEALLVPIRVDRAELKLSGGALRVPRTTARAGRSDLSVSGQVQDVLPWAMGSEELRPTFSLVVESQILDLDEMVPLKSTAWRGRPKGVGWTWAVPASAAVADRVEDETSPILPMVRAMDGKAELRVAELKSAGVVLRRLAAVAVAKDGILRVNDVRANVYGGDMKARAKVDARAPSGTLPMTAEVSVDSLQANGLVQEFLKWSLPIHGRMGFSMTMSGRMDSTLGLVPEEIDARCAAGMREGKIMNWGWLKQAGSGVAQLGFLDLEEIPVQQMKASFGVKDSRVSLDDVQLRAADAPCRLSGSAGFDGSLDYVLDVDMPASQLNVGGVNLGDALGAFLTGGGSHIPLRFHIGGTVDQPRIVAGVQPRTREEAKKSREEGKLKEKAKGFLRKLF